MKKNIFFFFVLQIVFCVSVFSQVPQKINYQGAANDANGNPLAIQNIGLRFSIHSGTVSGIIVYQETHNTTTDNQGVFDLLIGDGNVVSGNFSAIDWGNDLFFLQNEMDITGGTNYVNMGTSQLVSVPYALYAKKSGSTSAINGPENHVAIFDSIGNAVYGNWGTIVIDTNLHNVGIGTTTPDPDAILDIASLSKGVLLPRLLTNQINLITNPQEGLLVYNIETHSFWFYNGTAWEEM